MNKEFTYKEVCEQFINDGAVFHTFNDFEYHYDGAAIKPPSPYFPTIEFGPDISQTKNKKVVMMRHDIDKDPSIAYKMAEIENDLQIRSTYFVLTTDTARWWWIDIEKRKLYLSQLKEMQNMGHEIGLHYDFFGDFFHVWDKNPLENIVEVLKILRDNGLIISGCAAHGSGAIRMLHGPDDLLPELVNHRIWEECNSSHHGKISFNSKDLDSPCLSLLEHGLLYEAYHVRYARYLSDVLEGGRHVGFQARYRPRAADVLKLCIEGDIVQILAHPFHWRDKLS